jgi:hypothetical protein
MNGTGEFEGNGTATVPFVGAADRVSSVWDWVLGSFVGVVGLAMLV